MRTVGIDSKELMIGDFLRHSNGQIMPVVRIECGSFACGTPHCWDYNNRYEFIELTEKFLQKNNFMRSDSLDYNENRVGISLLYKERSDGEPGYRVLIENRRPGEETRTIIKSVKYVHEIQHALKELQIEIEILLDENKEDTSEN